MRKEKGPTNEQASYDLGYDNPAKSERDYSWAHLVFINAYVCGRYDAQNHAPRNKEYGPSQYDSSTFERLPPKVDFGS